MKKVFLLIFVCLFLFAFVGCESEKTYYWEFEKDYTKVVEMKIIVTPYGESFDIDTYKVIKDIDLSYAAQMYDDVGNITMTQYYGNLASPNKLCILIKFDNGEFDVISCRESKHYRYDENGKLTGYNSWLISDSNDFHSVIAKYLALD